MQSTCNAATSAGVLSGKTDLRAHVHESQRTCRSKAYSQLDVLNSCPGCVRGGRGRPAAAPRLLLAFPSDPGCTPRASAARLSPIIAANACTAAAGCLRVTRGSFTAARIFGSSAVLFRCLPMPWITYTRQNRPTKDVVGLKPPELEETARALG